MPKFCFQVPGNAGFLDQTMALTWVQKHIMNFGGDKDKVNRYFQTVHI